MYVTCCACLGRAIHDMCIGVVLYKASGCTNSTIDVAACNDGFSRQRNTSQTAAVEGSPAAPAVHAIAALVGYANFEEEEVLSNAPLKLARLPAHTW